MFDRNRSGSIELHEFQALWTYIGQWRQVFDQFDRDRSGAIDGSELQTSKSFFHQMPENSFGDVRIIEKEDCFTSSDDQQQKPISHTCGVG